MLNTRFATLGTGAYYAITPVEDQPLPEALRDLAVHNFLDLETTTYTEMIVWSLGLPDLPSGPSLYSL